MTPTNRIENTNSGGCSVASTQDFIRNRPDESVLLALAAGAAVGVALGIAAGGSSRSGLGYNRRVAEGLGERLMHSLERVLPDSISSSFGGK